MLKTNQEMPMEIENLIRTTKEKWNVCVDRGFVSRDVLEMPSMDDTCEKGEREKC